MLRLCVLSLIFSLLHFDAFGEETLKKKLTSSCKEIEKINTDINFIVEFSKYSDVDIYYSNVVKLIKQNCTFKKPVTLSGVLVDLEKKAQSFLANGRRAGFNQKVYALESYQKGVGKKCDLSISDIQRFKKYTNKFGMKAPESLSHQILDLMYQKDVEKFKKNIDQCFSNYLWHLSCGDHAALSLISLIDASKKRSIEVYSQEAFKVLDRECTDPREKEIVAAIKAHMKAPIEDSLRVEYMRQEKLLVAVAGKRDHRPIVKEMKRIVDKLGHPNLIQRFAMLHERIRLPEVEEYKKYQSKRKNKCTNIDNTNSFIRFDQDQAETQSCFSFGAANLMNYHLGISGVSPLYLFTLSIATTDALWYPVERAWRAIWMEENSISFYNGGFSRGVIEKALERGKYCSTSDIRDMGKDSKNIDEIIIKTESVGLSAKELKTKFDNGDISEEHYRAKLFELFKMIKPFFPKSTISEFKESVQHSESRTQFFENFLFSQCKTPLPKGAKSLKVESSYAFSDLISISLDGLDKLIENQNIAAIGVQSDMLFKDRLIDSWSPHIVTLSGRRWNKEKNQCEFRIINSWGDTCDGITNLAISCDDDKKELWVDELLILKHGNSLTTISDSPMIRARKDPRYEEYDPEL
jgi:hypothetical protein